MTKRTFLLSAQGGFGRSETTPCLRPVHGRSSMSVCERKAAVYRCLVFLPATIVCLVIASAVRAQVIPPHYFSDARMPPGAVGAQQLWRAGVVVPMYYQPVRILAPENAIVSVAENGQFGPGKGHDVIVGLLVGHVYRLRVSNIPGYEDFEVFPTVEIVSRLFPPPGKRWQYPVPVVLTKEELVMALEGRLVTRVVYLEDPQRASPIPQNPLDQPYYEADSTANILEVADRLGRPMVIVRMGSRVPDWDADSRRFLFETPPVEWPPQAPAKTGQAGAEQANVPIERSGLEPGLSGRDYPRVALPYPFSTRQPGLPTNRH